MAELVKLRAYSYTDLTTLDPFGFNDTHSSRTKSISHERSRSIYTYGAFKPRQWSEFSTHHFRTNTALELQVITCKVERFGTS